MNHDLTFAAGVPCRIGPRCAPRPIAPSRRRWRRKVPTDDDDDEPGLAAMYDEPPDPRSVQPTNESNRMNSTLLSRMAVLAIGFTAALTGVAQAATAPTQPVPPPPAVGKNYDVTVHTGNRSNAGTDGNVFLRLYGTHGVSPEVQLDNSEDNFERNKYDRFTFRFADLGTLTRACVRFDPLSGGSAAWYLDWVEVNGEFFQYYRWFDTKQTICRNA